MTTVASRAPGLSERLNDDPFADRRSACQAIAARLGNGRRAPDSLKNSFFNESGAIEGPIANCRSRK
jgi:hypothetical protein